jgi:hypothetical protein
MITDGEHERRGGNKHYLFHYVTFVTTFWSLNVKSDKYKYKLLCISDCVQIKQDLKDVLKWIKHIFQISSLGIWPS